MYSSLNQPHDACPRDESNLLELAVNAESEIDCVHWLATGRDDGLEVDVPHWYLTAKGAEDE